MNRRFFLNPPDEIDLFIRRKEKTKRVGKQHNTQSGGNKSNVKRAVVKSFSPPNREVRK